MGWVPLTGQMKGSAAADAAAVTAQASRWTARSGRSPMSGWTGAAWCESHAMTPPGGKHRGPNDLHHPQ